MFRILDLEIGYCMRSSFRQSFIVLIVLPILVAMMVGCSPKTFDEGWRDAEQKLGMGDASGALKVYRKLSDTFPDDPKRPQVLFQISNIQKLFMDDPEGAISTLTKIIDEYPFMEIARISREKRAELNGERGDFESALVDYDALIKYFSTGSNVYQYRLLMGASYIGLKNYKQARSEFKGLLEDRSAPPEAVEFALFSIGESFFLEDRLGDAARYYETMLQNFPDSELAGEARLHLAMCLGDMGYLGMAKEEAERASEQYPNRDVVREHIMSITSRGMKTDVKSRKKD